MRLTIFADVTLGITIWKGEIFGPVLCRPPFDTEDEAIALANDTAYDLTNYIQTFIQNWHFIFGAGVLSYCYGLSNGF